MVTVAKSKRNGPSRLDLVYALLRKEQAQEAKAAKKADKDPPAKQPTKAAAPRKRAKK